MKKIKLLALAGVAAAPVVALPLINATSVTTKALASTNETNATVTLNLVEGHEECGTYTMTLTRTADDTHAEITAINQKADCTGDYNWVVPATYVDGGVVYPVTKISTKESAKGNNKSMIIDLSQATNLTHIAPYSFDRSSSGGECTINVRWVYFRGATSLKEIGDYAFRYQHFSNKEPSVTNWDMDFSSTKLEKIGTSAFQKCCQDNENQFNGLLILPPTLTNIYEYGFWEESSTETWISFKSVIFNNKLDTVTSGLMAYDRTLPQLNSTDYHGFVPYGTKTKYTSTVKTVQNSKNKYFTSNDKWLESQVTYTNHGGNTTLASAQGVAGQDSKDWAPYFGSNDTKVTDNYTLKLDRDIPGISIVDDKVTWDNTLAAGTYQFKVECFYTDPTTSEVNFVIGDTITLNITNAAELTGGSTALKGNSYMAGEDQTDNPTPIAKNWSVTVPSGAGTVQSVQYTLNNLGTLTNYVSLNTTATTAQVKWERGIPAGLYSFTLSAVATTDVAGSKFTCSKDISLEIDEDYYAIKMYTTDGGGNKVELKDSDLALTKNSGTKTFTVELSENNLTKKGEMSDPKLSIISDHIKLEAQAGNADGVYNLTIDTNNLNCGLYKFYIHTTAVTGLDYEVYSTMRTITIYDTDHPALAITGDDTDMYGTKKHASTKDYGWQILGVEGSLGSWTITDVNTSKAEWETKDRKDNIHASASPIVTRGISLNWDEGLSTDTNVLTDMYDFNVNVTLAAGAVTQTVVLPLSIISESYAEVSTNAPSIINGYAYTASTVNKYQFKLNINGVCDPSTQNVEFSANPEDLSLQGKVRFVETASGSDEFYIVWDETIPEGQYVIDVTGYDKNSGFEATKRLILNLRNEMVLNEYPTILNSYMNQPNCRSDEAFIFNFNGVEAKKDDFTKIEILCDGVEAKNMSLNSKMQVAWNGTDWTKGTHYITFNFTHKSGLEKSIVVPLVSSPTPEEEKIVTLGVKTKPNKVNYKLGEGFNSDGLVVVGYTIDGLPVSVEKGQYTLDVAEGEKLMVAGQKTVNVSYNDIKTSFTIAVDDTDPDPSAIDGIRVIKKPLKKDYVTGEALDLQGLEVSLMYKNGTTKSVYNFDTDVRDGEILTQAGAKTITVTYGQWSTTFAVNVTKAASEETTQLKKATIAGIAVGSVGAAVGIAAAGVGIANAVKLSDKKKKSS